MNGVGCEQFYDVSLFTREWIEIKQSPWYKSNVFSLPLYEGVDWNHRLSCFVCWFGHVSLFTREWIEISDFAFPVWPLPVSLFTREWIEISPSQRYPVRTSVSLFTREWIEIHAEGWKTEASGGLPLYEGVDWNKKSECRSGRYWSLPLYEGVDWNWEKNTQICVLFCLPLYEGVDWNVQIVAYTVTGKPSPSLRGSGLKYHSLQSHHGHCVVSLFTREWIEMKIPWNSSKMHWVSLFTREWIEIARTILYCQRISGLPLYEGVDWNSHSGIESILNGGSPSLRGSGLKFGVKPEEWEPLDVSLFTREWIEIANPSDCTAFLQSPSLRGSGLKFHSMGETYIALEVSLFTREWIEITISTTTNAIRGRLPLYEGVDWNPND